MSGKGEQFGPQSREACCPAGEHPRSRDMGRVRGRCGVVRRRNQWGEVGLGSFGLCSVTSQALLPERPIRSPLGDHLTSRLPPGGASGGAGQAVGSSGTRSRGGGWGRRVWGSPGRLRAARSRPARARQAPPPGLPGRAPPRCVRAPRPPARGPRAEPRAPEAPGPWRRRQRSNPLRAMSSPVVARSSQGESQEADPRPRSRGRFWEVGGGGDRLERAAAESERWELLLRRGELLALGGHLKGALEAYAAALRRGAPVRPECLGTLVDCLVFNYRLRHGLGWSATPAEGAHPGAGGLLSCLGCRGFLSEPVTVACGHSYCRRCLRRELRARCRLCRDRLPPAAAADAEGTSPRPPPLAAAIAASGFRTSVVLNHLAEKWFPGERERARAAGRLGELLHQGRYREALAAACEELRTGDRAGPATPPSFPRRAGGHELVYAPGRLPEAGCRSRVGSGVLEGVGGGGAPGCFGHSGDRPRADCDAARGSLRCGLALWRARPERSGAARVAGRGRPSAGWGGSWASLSGCSLPAALFPVIGRSGRAGPGPPRGDASRGGERIPRRGWVCNVYLGLPQKSPGQLETAGGRIA